MPPEPPHATTPITDSAPASAPTIKQSFMMTLRERKRRVVTKGLQWRYHPVISARSTLRAARIARRKGGAVMRVAR
jgi:hypothetical protein